MAATIVFRNKVNVRDVELETMRLFKAYKLPLDDWRYDSILASVLLPDSPQEDPRKYFDFSCYSGANSENLAWMANIQPAEFWVKARHLEILNFLKEKFPKT
ncbi:MAG: hypothetical protein I8H71_05540 [Xanthomonadaceae bacterium]|nr:hypothetical protein [Xanthomonadaceae bacterium]